MIFCVVPDCIFAMASDIDAPNRDSAGPTQDADFFFKILQWSVTLMYQSVVRWVSLQVVIFLCFSIYLFIATASGVDGQGVQSDDFVCCSLYFCNGESY